MDYLRDTIFSLDETLPWRIQAKNVMSLYKSTHYSLKQKFSLTTFFQNLAIFQVLVLNTFVFNLTKCKKILI